MNFEQCLIFGLSLNISTEFYAAQIDKDGSYRVLEGIDYVNTQSYSLSNHQSFFDFY